MSSRESARRVLDASLNRASEGLRVAEDVCRFHWNLPGLSSELKAIRHELLRVGLEAGGSRARIVSTRDIEGDVGRSARDTRSPSNDPEPELPGDSESQPSLPEVALRNLQRAKEAVRTIEETARVLRPALVETFRELRYRLYSTEKALSSLGTPGDRRERLARARLYLLASAESSTQPLEQSVEEALHAGVDIVQLREKDLGDRELLSRARVLREITARHRALLIVNDRPDIAVLAHADGVHVGQDDLPVAAVRSVVGPEMLIGVSTHSVEDVLRATREGAQYIGVGPMFETRTKDAGEIFGPRGLAAALASTHLPAFAIGGISEANLHEIVRAGGRRLAISAAILQSNDVGGTVRRLLAQLGG